jgi:Beta-galactosidase
MPLWSWRILLLASLLGAGSAQAGPLTELYFYPHGHQFSDGSTLPSVQTVTIEDITTNFPAIPQMSGVALTVYWSTLCPNSGACDFSLVDQALDYWGARGKKVVLAVATTGFPIRAVVNGNAEIQHATPDWVLAHSSTYRIKTPVLAQPKYASEIDAVYPDFRDTRFTDEVASLIRLLAARYDSNPTIAQLRIGTGDMGEDNPRMGPLSAPLPGYTEDMWLQFCRRVTALYLAAFHRRELEFDIGRLSWMYALGSARDKTAVDGFVSYLLRNKVFLAFDGLESSDLARLRTPAPRDGIALRSLICRCTSSPADGSVSRPFRRSSTRKWPTSTPSSRQSK